jgi:hypothetical protein
MGRAKTDRKNRAAARELAADTPPPFHADRWPWEWVPILGLFVRRRRLAAAAGADRIHAAALKKAQKRTARALRYISQ